MAANLPGQVPNSRSYGVAHRAATPQVATLPEMKLVGLVPARWNSKGIPRKNWIPLLPGDDRTLVDLVAESLTQSDLVNTTYVSTDVPDPVVQPPLQVHFRSEEASQDHATADDVVWDFIKRGPKRVVARPDDIWIVYLQPTSPLRRARHIDAAVRMAQESQRSVVSVRFAAENPSKMLWVRDDGLVEPVVTEKVASGNRQWQRQALSPNGAVYVFPVSEFLSRGTFPITGAMPLLMSSEESLDLDTLEDVRDWRKRVHGA